MEKVPGYVSSVLVVLKVFCSLFPSPLGIPQFLGKHVCGILLTGSWPGLDPSSHRHTFSSQPKRPWIWCRLLIKLGGLGRS